LKDTARGVPVAQELLQRRAKDPGKDHPDYAKSLYDLATLQLQKPDRSAAEPLLREAWEIQQRRLGEAHPTTLHTLSQRCLLHIGAAQYGEAEQLCLLFRDTADRHAKDNRANIVAARLLLATLYEAKGDPPQAEKLYLEARD